MKFRMVSLVAVFTLLLTVLASAPLAGASSGEPAPSASPAAAMTGVKAVASGGSFTCAINQSDGSVSCWGANGSGQLGDGTTGSRDLPVKPQGLGTNVQDIVAGTSHVCAITSAGGVKCWGDNQDGQLGTKDKVNRLVPTDVDGLTSGAKSLAAGQSHTCALLTDGSAKCWGANDKYQLGDGTTNTSLKPIAVPGLTNVTAVAAGAKHTCAIVQGGGLKCWGANASGQVGNGTNSQFASKTPQDVHFLSSGVTSVAGGEQHTCAVANGSVFCWGENANGQLGLGNTTNEQKNWEPNQVPGISAKLVSLGLTSSCAVRSDNTVSCWGANSSGQLGNGSSSDSSSPTTVSGLGNVTALSAGSAYACAVSGGALQCWGDNLGGQLADGSIIYRAVRSDITSLGAVSSLTAGFGHTCAIKSNGELDCWGNNGAGQIGDGTTVQRSAPVKIASMTGATQVSAGGAHTCALIAGSVSCWGYNNSGQLGDGTLTDRTTPGQTVPQLVNVTSIVTGGAHSCALVGGGVKCWGLGDKGQLGDGTKQNRTSPTDIVGLSDVAMLAAGAEHTCALLNSGAVKCWGSNSNGQIGNGTQDDAASPVSVTGLPQAKAVTAGGSHTCALLNDDSIRCWGLNDKGQLGDESNTSHTTPVAVSAGSVTFSDVAAGGPHTCAVATTGALYCWGSGVNGELGNWNFANANKPVLIQGAASEVTDLAAGLYHTCAEFANKVTACWGWDSSGQLGQGTVTQHFTPVPAQASMPATLAVSPSDGKPGSSFQVTGMRFTPNQSVTFTLNGVSAGLTLPADPTSSGSFVVDLDTTGNLPGAYVIRATQTGSSAIATVRLDNALATRVVYGSSLKIAAPGAQPLVLKPVYLPFLRRP